jgi:hypothetical protein
MGAGQVWGEEFGGADSCHKEQKREQMREQVREGWIRLDNEVLVEIYERR